MSAFRSAAAKSVAAALILSAATATPVFAQAAISEPGVYSFYHPNGDVLNAGAVRPAPDAFAMASTSRVDHHRARHASHDFVVKRTDRYSGE
jgi:hypothetical protein